LIYLPKQLHNFFYAFCYNHHINAYDLIVGLIYQFCQQKGFTHTCEFKMLGAEKKRCKICGKTYVRKIGGHGFRGYDFWEEAKNGGG